MSAKPRRQSPAPSPRPARTARAAADAASATAAEPAPSPASAARLPVPAPAAEADGRRKPVRDSFTMPPQDHALIAHIKERALRLEHPAKKSEVLRAGLKALAAMDDFALRAVLQSVPSLKTGRPRRDAAADEGSGKKHKGDADKGAGRKADRKADKKARKAGTKPSKTSAADAR